jgi:methionyl-tRNA formyltransferase
VRVVFAGTPDVAVPSLRALLASRHEVVAVVTRPDARVGRGRRLAPAPVAAVADEAGLEVLKPTRPAEPDFVARLREIDPDCCPVVAYGALLPPEVLDIPRHGWVNLHFSVLPAWRGAAPVQRALMAGDEVTGATTFRIVSELDAGPTYGTSTEAIKPDDTSGSLLTRLGEHGAELLVATLDGIEEGVLEARPQPVEGVTLAPKVTVQDARIDWARPAFAVDRHIRACTPAPGAWTVLGDARLKLGPVRLVADDEEIGTELPAGAVEVRKHAVYVGTRTGPVELGTVQAPGKPAMAAADWARGLRDAPKRFG